LTINRNRHAARIPEVSVVIPCLDEAGAIERCVTAALKAMRDADLAGEVVVVDNGSMDGSPALAEIAGARVIHEARRGYGNALRAGFAAAGGRYVVMADADLTYDFAYVPRFVESLRAGADLVIGDRMGNIDHGAMPWLHRYVGNPVLTGVLNSFFGSRVRDAHCGMRAFRRDALEAMDLQGSGMELASEMVIRAVQENLEIDQIPIRYRRREGDSKLAPLSDSWRHLRYLLLHSPSHLFLLPAAALTALGVLCSLTVLLGIPLFGRTWQLHALVAGSLLTVVGVQLLGLGLCAHTYGARFLGTRVPWFDRLRERLPLEQALLAGGGALVACGLTACMAVVGLWVANDFGELREERIFLAGATLVIVGMQFVFTSFLLSILGLRRGAARLDLVPAENGAAVPGAALGEGAAAAVAMVPAPVSGDVVTDVRRAGS
jgi:glycosyl transferase family 2